LSLIVQNGQLMVLSQKIMKPFYPFRTMEISESRFVPLTECVPIDSLMEEICSSPIADYLRASQRRCFLGFFRSVLSCNGKFAFAVEYQTASAISVGKMCSLLSFCNHLHLVILDSANQSRSKDMLQ